MKPVEIKFNRTEREWIEIFNNWSERMDKLYKGEERHDAPSWSDNPAEWMEPFNMAVWNSWCEYDGGCPQWTRHLVEAKLVR